MPTWGHWPKSEGKIEAVHSLLVAQALEPSPLELLIKEGEIVGEAIVGNEHVGICNERTKPVQNDCRRFAAGKVALSHLLPFKCNLRRFR